MAWKFPRRIPKSGQIHDHRDMDAGFLPFVEEIDGSKLNEHNFQDSLADELTITDFDDGYALGTATDSTDLQLINANLSSAVALRAQGGWSTICTQTVVLPEGGWVEGLGGAQYLYGTQGGGMDPDALDYLQSAIRVDGSIIPEAFSGDQDNLDEDSHMEVGYSGAMGALQSRAVLYLGPGKHTLDFVVRAVNLRYSADDADFEEYITLYNSELSILAGWR